MEFISVAEFPLGSVPTTTTHQMKQKLKLQAILCKTVVAHAFNLRPQRGWGKQKQAVL